MSVLIVENVCKNFGEKKAVDNVTVDIEGDQIFGLLGPNGAGKTTLIRMIMGIYLPDSGQISIFNKRLSELSDGELGYLPEERGLYPKMKCADLLSFFLELKGVPYKKAKIKSIEALEMVGLKEYANKKVEELSKGMQQKVQLLAAINHQPKLAILDEPFSGLDPVNVELFKEIIKEAQRKGTTVVLSSHQMELVEQMCHKIALINKGRIVLDGEVGEIRRKYGSKEVRIEFGSTIPEIDFSEYADNLKIEAGNMTLSLKRDVSHKALINRIWESGAEIVKFEVGNSSLHDIFVKVVKEGEKNEN
ncbi:MAG: ATP-binding cassette domain-containing protein [Acidobacteria bacterium]|nr:ATP-binding cassette domain-containing protein [Acidobacteriota bacterium]